MQHLGGKQLQQVARRICNFCGELLRPSLKGSENGYHLQDECMGKGGSNTYVISTLLLLSINISQALSRAQPCPATAMGSKAKFHSRRSANTYLFICLHNFQRTVKRQNNLHIFWLTRQRASF